MNTEHMKETHAALMGTAHRCDTGMTSDMDGMVIRSVALLLRLKGHENGPKNLIAVAERCERGTATVKDGSYLEYTANAHFGGAE